MNVASPTLRQDELYDRLEIKDAIRQSLIKASIESKQVLYISGSNGSGKSSIGSYFHQQSQQLNAHHFSIKYLPQDKSIPFQGIKRALSRHIGSLIKISKPLLISLKQRLRELPTDISIQLCQLLPELKKLIDLPAGAVSAKSKVSQDQLLQRLIGALFLPNLTIAIYLDDAQWLDDDSIELLAYLMADEFDHNLVICISESTSAEANPALAELLKDPELQNKIQQHALKELEETAVIALVCDYLGDDSDEIVQLAQYVFQRTNGHPATVVNFLYAMISEKLVKYDSELQLWDTQHSQLNLDPKHLLHQLAIKKTKDLNPELNQLLHICCCLGDSFDAELPLLAIGQIEADSSNLLNQLVSLELLEFVESSSTEIQFSRHSQQRWLRFRHQDLRHLLLNNMDRSQRSSLHLAIARQLDASNGNNNSFNYSIANHINQADIDDSLKLWQLNANYAAAIQAQGENALVLALEYFQYAYKASETLNATQPKSQRFNIIYNLADTHYKLNHESQALQWIDTGLASNTNINFRVRIQRLSLKYLLSQTSFEQTYARGRKMLKQLGISMPMQPGLAHISLLRLQLGPILNSRFIEQRAADKNEIKTAFDILLNLLYASFYQGQHWPLYLSLKILSLSKRFGLSSETSLALVCYGALQVSQKNGINKAKTAARLALQLRKRFTDPNTNGLVMVASSSLITPWLQASKETLPGLQLAQELLAEHNETEWSLLAQSAHGFYSFHLGHYLPTVRKELIQNAKLTQKNNQYIPHRLNSLMIEASERLMKAHQQPWDLNGRWYKDNKHASPVENLAKAVLQHSIAFWFGQHNYCEAVRKQIQPYNSLLVTSPLAVNFFYLDTLNSIQLYANDSNFHNTIVRLRIQRNIRKLKNWVKQKAEHFSFQLHTCLAAWADYKNKTDEAIEHYEKAIRSCQQQDLPAQEALTHWLAARFYQRQGKHHYAARYYRNAHYGLISWGADALAQKIQDKLDQLKSEEHSTYSISLNYNNIQGDNDQVSTILSLSEQLLTQKNLTDIQHLLQQSTVRLTGGQRSCLILIKNNKYDQIIESKSMQAAQYIGTTLDFNWHNLPKDVLTQCVENQQAVIINDTSDQPLQGLVLKPASLLCLPMFDSNQLLGLWYIEQVNLHGAFTPNRVRLLNLVASQAANAIRHIILLNRLEKTEQDYKHLFEDAPEGLFICNNRGVLQNANRSTAKLLGFSTVHSLLRGNKYLFDLSALPQQDQANFFEIMDKNGRVEGFEAPFLLPDGDMTWLSLSCHKVFTDYGKTQWEGSIIDINERKKTAMLALNRWQSEQEQSLAETSATAKQQLLVNLNHELRNPLNALMGFSEQLKPTLQADSQNQHIDAIIDSAQALKQVLDHSNQSYQNEERATANTLFNPADILHFIQRLFQPQLDEKNLRFNIINEIIEHSLFLGDPIRLQQVLINLVGNAIKFTHNGIICLTAKARSSQVETILEFEVSDTGIGINDELLPLLFTSFVQDRDSEQRYGGSGLGLAISRRLIQQMGGEIQARSAVGAGSAFSFHVNVLPPLTTRSPFTHEQQPPSDEQKRRGQQLRLEDIQLQNKRVLVAEDDPLNQQLLLDQLGSLGIEVTLTANGQEAVDAFAQTDTGFDAIIMDLHMPVLDGYQACVQIIAMQQYNQVPILVVSAYDQDSDNDLLQQLGVQGYLTKPVAKYQLAQQLHQIIHQLSDQDNTTVNNHQQSSTVVDWSLALDNHNQKLPLLIRLLNDFIHYYKNVPEQIQQHLDRQNLDEAGRLVHSLVGVAGNFAAEPLRQCARSLEKSLQSKALMNEFTQAHEQFLDEVEIYLKNP